MLPTILEDETLQMPLLTCLGCLGLCALPQTFSDAPPRGRARARSALERNSWGISEAFQSSFEAGNSDSAVRRGVRRCRIAVCAG